MEIRLAATRYIWGAFALMMLGLMSTTIFGNSSLGVGHVIIAVVLAIAAFVSTGTVWNWGDSSNASQSSVIAQASKQKRNSVERLANELDSMSDDDLERLRSRLSGDVREVLTTPAYGVSDDGELMRR
jgi:hypothetical protein